ncbi:MAG: glutamine--fructose-6-phosphate transaminase (isomerizing) [Rickettsiales bacterium]|jgi:glucosamine--fructose-6-phosphate aminotransferase (isomerizing)|nr:glutamine--fructose-6-phosphate transaminase (isomerizing) [Rickettsiales bacterium]
MCGIVGIVGNMGSNVVGQTIMSLKQLEYRGYDSAGIAILADGNFNIVRSVGKIKNLEEKIPENFRSSIALAHTRWATHGKVSEANTHPHISFRGDVTVVHNGIIENYAELKNFLLGEGFQFYGETDSEVIGNLVSHGLMKNKDMEEVFFTSLEQLAGSYSIALIHRDQPDRLFAAKNGSPLVLGSAPSTSMVASSTIALSGFADSFIQLKDGERAIISADSIRIVDSRGHRLDKPREKLDMGDTRVSKNGFDHYMLKEIYEQPDVMRRTIREYIDVERSEINFGKFSFDMKKINFLTIVACGTSYHAGCVAKYFIEDMADVFVNVDIASEFRYRTNPLKRGNLALFISQSGETADTLAALKYCREKKQKILSIVNVAQSAMAGLSDSIIGTMAGVEIGVASTKSFTAQVAVLYLLAIEMARQREKISIEKYHSLVADFVNSVDILDKSLVPANIDKIERISSIIAKAPHLIYMGRDILFPMALEGALKIKEISYIPTYGIASGELKHGSIALIDPDTFVVALGNSDLLYEKNLSSMEEILARNGKIIAIGDRVVGDTRIFDSIETPATKNKFEVFLSMVVPTQLLAYYAGVHRETDIDQPRNLAKSVTVE